MCQSLTAGALSASHDPNDHSVFGMTVRGSFSRTRTLSVGRKPSARAVLLSVLTVGYGLLPALNQPLCSGSVVAAFSTVSSLRTVAVSADPSGFFATGTCIIMRLLPPTTSGCHPNQTTV